MFHDRQCRPVDPPYLLYVSQYAPSKGYSEAYEVIAALADLGHPHRLKIAGRIWPWVQPEIDAVRRAARRPDLVDMLGYVEPDTELPDLLRGSERGASARPATKALGLPIAEAMAAGVPAVAFANTAALEVVGDGGLLIPDGDVEAMVKAVHRLLESSSAWGYGIGESQGVGRPLHLGGNGPPARRACTSKSPVEAEVVVRARARVRPRARRVGPQDSRLRRADQQGVAELAAQQLPGVAVGDLETVGGEVDAAGIVA